MTGARRGGVTAALGVWALWLTVAPAAALAGPAALATVTSEVAPPGGAGASPDVVLAAVACVPANGCLLVGSYTTAAGRIAPLLARSVNGVAQRTAAGQVPASAGSKASASLRGVSCPMFDECLAVGDYTTASGRTVGYADGWDGAGQYPTVPPLPGGTAANPRASLGAVSCPPAGGCVAVGSVATSSGPATGLVDRLSPAGHWLAALAVSAPTGAAAPVRDPLTSVSCWTTGSCVAAGTYLSAAGATLPYEVRLAGSVPGAAVAIALPGDAASDPHAAVAGVSCATSSWCVATGTYRTAGGAIAVFATVTTPSGSTATTLGAPGDAIAGEQATGGAIACAAPSSCVLSASYVDTTHQVAGLVDTLGPAGWASPQRVVAPATSSGAAEHLDAVACTAVGKCTVAGSFEDAAHRAEGALGAAFLAPGPVAGLSARQVGTASVQVRWSAPAVAGAGVAAYEVTAQAGGSPAVSVATTSATAVTLGALRAGVHYRFTVVAVADDHQRSGAAAVVLTTLQAATAPRAVHAHAASRSAVLTWAPPADTFGQRVTGYVVLVSWSGGQEHLSLGDRTTVTVPGLTAARTYRFEVAATTPAGTGAWSGPVSCTPTA